MPTLPEIPAKKDNEEEDEAQLGDFPWFEPPFKCDYGDRLSYVLSLSLYQCSQVR